MKRQTKKSRRPRRSHRNQKGGLVDTDRARLIQLGFSEQDINYLFEQNPDMMIDFFENSVNPPPNNPFFPSPQTPVAIMAAIRENDAQDFGPVPNIEEVDPDEGVTDNEFSQSYGGRKMRRTHKRIRTHKRSRMHKKSRTHKRRTHRRGTTHKRTKR
jgi:hypothetical protein